MGIPVDLRLHRNKLSVVVLILAVLIIATGLRVWTLSAESLDGDEMFSYGVVNSELPAAVQEIRDDLVHPPLYYLTVKTFWGVLPHSALGIRLISLLAGTATIGVLAYLGICVPALRGPAILAAALVAVNDSHIFYSQQARSYALYTLLSTLLLLWCWLGRKYEQRNAYWVTGVGLMSALVYTHYVGALFIGCLVVGTWIGPVSRRTKRLTLTSGVVAAMTFLPWVLLEINVYKRKHGLHTKLGWQTTDTANELKAIWASFMGIAKFPGATTFAVLVGVALIGLALWWVLQEEDLHRLRAPMICTALMAFVPPIVLFLLSVPPVSLPIFGLRHLLPCLIAWCLLVAVGVFCASIVASRWLKPSWGVIVALSLLLITMQLQPTMANTYNGHRRFPYERIARDLESGGTLPVYTTWPSGIGATVNYYLRSPRRVAPLPPESSLEQNFAVLYRPDIASEASRLKALEHAGWCVAGYRRYRNHHHSSLPVDLVWMSKPIMQ
jgi:hypothetical protein